MTAMPKDISDGYKAMLAEERTAEEARIAKDKQVMVQVESMVSVKGFKDIKDELADGGYVHDFSIVDEPNGDLQEDEEFEHGFRYVDQSCGFSCDDYYGTVCIPISKTQFFRFNYSM